MPAERVPRTLAHVIPSTWRPVLRDDGEHVGYVEVVDSSVHVARDLLGVELGRLDDGDLADELVVERGLASLGRRWDWTDDEGTVRRVHVVSVEPHRVVVSDGYPGVVGAPGVRFELALPVDPERFRPA